LQEQFGVTIKGIKILIFGLPGTYFTGDGALRDEVGYYRIGRVDDVIVFQEVIILVPLNEDAINEHPAVAESAIVGFPHDIKGNALYGYVILKETGNQKQRKPV
jgi:acetyl-CoA synthetase